MEFKTGDVVVLKSGGPNMTVEKVGARNSSNPEVVVHCVWFENEKDTEGKFLPETLMLAPEG